MSLRVANFLLISFGLLCLVLGKEKAKPDVSVSLSKIWGPGLNADFRVPVRYFFIQAVDAAGNNFNDSLGEDVFQVSLAPLSGQRARIWTQVLDRHDGSYVVRFRPYSTNRNVAIEVLYHGQHVAQSPYVLKGLVYHEHCDCPNHSVEEWARAVGCPSRYDQIEDDLRPFPTMDMKKAAKEAVERFSDAGHHSVCHYKLIGNQVYRKCYGEHVGFKMFSDAILLSLTRKMRLPDVEFFMNLGDWPLAKRKWQPIPIISWCGSQETYDIVVPTYDLTEATLEMMGRITLDIFSTQANTGPKWINKTNVAFWRGRDSRRERLDLVEMSRNNPTLVDAALTNMFFFPKDEDKYGKIVSHVSFFDFFKSKYQLNIDGTVAAYRLPYLLVGDSAIFKQDSNYYEHFYKELEPNVHYIPLKRDLSDVLEKIRWARQNDEEGPPYTYGRQRAARGVISDREIRFKCFAQNTIYDVLRSRPGWQEVQGDGEWDFYWCDREWLHANYDTMFLQEHQKILHFRNHYELTRKNLMVKNLKRLRKQTERELGKQEAQMFDFFPSTFELPSEYHIFVEEFKRNPGLIWIMKPAAKSQGKGIFLFRKLKDITDWKKGEYQPLGDPNPPKDMPETYVVQRYIENPYLIGGRKFDIRIYVLVVSYNPLKVWLYREGFARFSNTRFSLDSLEDTYIHLTNVAVQKTSPDYDPEKGCKWSTQQLRKYLVAKHGTEAVRQLGVAIDNIIIKSLQSVQKIIINDKHCFEMYGYDVLLDENLKPWLIEINASPSLTASGKEDYDLKCGLLNDVLNVLDLENRLSGKEKRVGGWDLLWEEGPVYIEQMTQESGLSPYNCVNSYLGCQNARKEQLREMYTLAQAMKK